MAHHAKFGAALLEETGSEQEFLTRTIKKVLDEETTSLENGLTMLATIGATAPFVGPSRFVTQTLPWLSMLSPLPL